MIRLETATPMSFPQQTLSTVEGSLRPPTRALTARCVQALDRLRPVCAFLAVLLAATAGSSCEQRTRTVTKYDDGTPCAEIEWKGGVLDGAYVLHHITGHVELEAHYVNGLREGTYAAWHPNGQRAVTGQYEHGLRVGTWQEWGETGAAISAGEYRAGDKTGTWRVFDAQGELVAEDQWENATRVTRRMLPANPTPSPKSSGAAAKDSASPPQDAAPKDSAAK